MPALYQKYKGSEHGVINAIEPSEIPIGAFEFSRNMLFRENYWRKKPGLTEIHNTAITPNPVGGIFRFHKPVSGINHLVATSGNTFARFNPGAATWTSIQTGLVAERFEFLENNGNVYYGSPEDLWRRYAGGNRTYAVGGENGAGPEAPPKFLKIIFNPYSGRFFGIGDPLNPDLLGWSALDIAEGIERWVSGNKQIIESIGGDKPNDIQLFEGRINIFSENSINSGTVIGVPENWNFQREKSQTGAISGRSVKRFGNSFFMLTPDAEVYRWPENKFPSLGRVKFNIDRTFMKFAVAEIWQQRYYVLTFKSGQAVPSNRYHTWFYDILGDRWYGPSLQRNIVTMYLDPLSREVLCGGVDDLEGFVFEMRGRDIKNEAMDCRLGFPYSDYGEPRGEKRYTKGWIKSKQEGVLPNNTGPLEVIIDVDNLYENSQSQRITLEDPNNQNLSDTGAVKEAITKRFFIHDNLGVGNAVRVELRHLVRAGKFEFSELEIEYFPRNYKKEDRLV